MDNITFNTDFLYKTYDSILGATITNLYSLSKASKDIIFNNFDYKNKIHRVFLESAITTSTLFSKKIGLHMPWFKYIIFKYITLRKRNSAIYRIKEKHENGIDIYSVAEFEAESFNHSIFVFEDIYDAYYENFYGRM
jgi:hypothetical protein